MARVQLKDSGVLFDEEQHTYLLGDKYLSGITGMLQRQFFPNEFEGIPQYIVDQAAEYGTSVHQSCEDFDHSWINDGTVEVQDFARTTNCSMNALNTPSPMVRIGHHVSTRYIVYLMTPLTLATSKRMVK